MNTLKVLFQVTKRKPYRVADAIQMSRSYIYGLIADGEIPRGTKLETLDRIANELGYSVKVEFLPKEEKMKISDFEDVHWSDYKT